MQRVMTDEKCRSVRDPILTDHFWLNPLSQHFSQICVSDLILVNEDGDVVVGDVPINAAAFAIHSESTFSRLSIPAIKFGRRGLRH
jgi:ribulose-5-phosphate 4-epimerase/fuculose-1-phosphate aldolase